MTAERQDAINDFLERAGWGEAVLSPLPGDASTRRYSRLSMNGHNAMLMDQPQDAEAPQCPIEATPDQRRSLGYNAVARLAGADCGRFVATAGFLRSQDLSAPDVYAADVARGFVLIEDLGDDLYANVLTGRDTEEYALYAEAVDALVKLHTEFAPQTLPGGKPLYVYDDTALLAESGLMTEWFMPLALGRPATADERLEHRDLWRDAVAPLGAGQQVFVHRDYHAQNLFWLPERKGAARVGMIDFQDAVAGPRSYDLISLVEDARRDVPRELADDMIGRYIERMVQSGSALDENAFRAEAAIMAAQRNAKIAGIFARLYKRDRKPRYLSYLPRVWTYLERDLEHPALASLKAWYDSKIPVERRREIRIPEIA